MLCFASLYWISGSGILLRGILSGATRLITTEPFSPERQLRFIQQYKVTFTMNASHQLVLMTKCEQFKNANLSSIKCVMVGGSKVPLHVKTEFIDRIPNANICNVYGLTELSAPLSIDYPASHGKDTVGRLIGGGYCVKIVDDNGKRCGVNVDGEICIKAIYTLLGYYGNQQATNEIFDDEGFLKTGDMGHFDADGDLYLIDRKKELLKYCGFQISPSEVDAFLTESSDIKSACVVGIPDAVMATDLPAAVIVRTEGSNITEQDVCDMVAGKTNHVI